MNYWSIRFKSNVFELDVLNLVLRRKIFNEPNIASSVVQIIHFPQRKSAHSFLERAKKSKVNVVKNTGGKF